MGDSSAIQEALASYRATASAAFEKLRSTPLPPVAKLTPYERSVFPALQQYLELAAEKYAKFKQNPFRNSKVNEQSRRKVRALGSSSKPVLSIAADIRREKWLVHLSEARHKLHARLSNALNSIFSAAPIPCGIPLDIRKRYADLKRTTNIIVRKPFQYVTCKLGSLDNLEQLLLVPSIIHTNRCRKSLANDDMTLYSNHKQFNQQQVQDTFESVRLIYRGKPDELYRRKNSKKFAAWRRRMRQMNQAKLLKETNAENTMRASRGYDQLLTQRSYGDTSFAPFLFETDSHAYAFSSKITNAPKLRKVMIDKYSSQEANNQEDPLQKAHTAAEVNPLFHTRVMNRFC